jgi:hypothetical protein
MKIPNNVIVWEDKWLEIPLGFTKVSWDSVKENTEVYITTFYDNKQHVLGPYFVSKISKLKDKNGLEFIEYIDGLLIKNE